MPTVFSDAAVGFVTAKVAAEATAPNTRIVTAAMALAALPDADALFISVIPYNSPLGHRGLTHLIWDKRITLRKIIAGGFALVGIVMWVIALIERG